MVKTLEEEEEDFNFDADVPDNPDRAKSAAAATEGPSENTIVRKKKEEVADVLALVNNAANFVDQVYKRASPHNAASTKAKAAEKIT